MSRICQDIDSSRYEIEANPNRLTGAPFLIVRGSFRFAPDLYCNKRTSKLCAFPLCGAAITIAAPLRLVEPFSTTQLC
jgi:hypothetical protein